MDSQMSPLSWPYMYQSMDELRYSLMYATLELETTRLEAQEEIKRREEEFNHLKDVLTRTIIERDESQQCQRLLMEKLLLLQQTASCIEDETRRGDSNTGISSSDCEGSIVSSPVLDPTTLLTPHLLQLASEKPLPEKGKLLQAVMKAGPLLQTLLLAGPLPEWQHPPPQLAAVEIPPVTIPSTHHDSPTFTINASNDVGDHYFNQKKRPLQVYQDTDSSIITKYHKIALQ